MSNRVRPTTDRTQPGGWVLAFVALAMIVWALTAVAVLLF